VLEQKRQYISLYGIHSDYWQQKPDAREKIISPNLHVFLPELARYFHAKAQRATEQLGDPQQHKDLTTTEKNTLGSNARNDFILAGDYYKEFIDSFTSDALVAEMYYLLAESRYAAEMFADAINAYETVAYVYPEFTSAAAAGYAAIISYNRLLEDISVTRRANQRNDSSAGDEYESWLRAKIDSQLRFANNFQQDPRAVTVLAKSSEELLDLMEYRDAIDAATSLTLQFANADNEVLKTAWLVIGHSEFELLNYANAEQAYVKVLGLLDPTAPDIGVVKASITDRLAASVYKQAESALAAGDQLLAADQFLRVYQVAPTSDISVTARFDAANTLMNAGQWLAAIPVLEAFRMDYPDHVLVQDIPAKLVLAYQETEQWLDAADELTVIYNSANDEALQQQSLYLAAELYAKAGDQQTAILRYRSYANQYQQPYGLVMEARYRLSELYRETNEPSKRRFWLRKIIAVDATAGSQRDGRSMYLAAFSSSVLANDSYQAFAAISLTLPLKDSLKKKRAAFDQALKAYQQLADYGLKEFSTEATHKLAELSRIMSSDLMASQRPAGLDALAIEQYDILLEEQAYPFEEKAISLYETNAQRSWSGDYDEWVQESFDALKKLLPARYGKEEQGVDFVNDIY
jgi:TolA-binding protein